MGCSNRDDAVSWTEITAGSETSTTTTTSPTVPNGPGVDTLLLVAVPSVMVFAAVVVMGILIRRR